MRIALGIEYDGSGFSGWQRQHHASSVQQHLEQALSNIANQEIIIHCAGRTDAKVHATGQVVHFDTTSERDMRNWVFGANSNLPPTISVRWAKRVADDFHARYKASARHYCYCIYNNPVRTSIGHSGLTWVYYHLNAELMQRGANFLKGEHDFSSFRDSECQAKTPIRHLYNIEVQREGDIISIQVTANAFLHHMVRNIVGVLLKVGSKQQPPQWVEQVLLMRDRKQAAITAPPQGLYLTAVEYPPQYAIPVANNKPWVGANLREKLYELV